MPIFAVLPPFRQKHPVLPLSDAVSIQRDCRPTNRAIARTKSFTTILCSKNWNGKGFSIHWRS